MALKYAPLARDEEGVFSASRLGLLEAADAYNPEKGAAFSTFAVITCKHAIFAELKKQRRHRRERPLFVIAPSGDEVERTDLPPVPPPDVDRPLLLALMRLALECLPDLERTILDLRYAVTGEGHSFRQISAALGIPASRTRRIATLALATLRRQMTGGRTLRELPLPASGGRGAGRRP